MCEFVETILYHIHIVLKKKVKSLGIINYYEC